MPLDGAAPDAPAPEGPGDDTAPEGTAPDGTAPDGIEGLTYEQARDELAEVVHRLEAGGVPLEESLALWERGERLAAACQSMLDGARQRLESRRQQA